MYINYKLFPTDRERTLNEYITFYRTRFPALFKWFYPSMREDGFVPSADRFKNDDRCFNGGTDDWSPNILPLIINPDGTFGHRDTGTPKDELGVYSMDPTALYFFSASVFFTALVPQVIWKVAGEDAWQAFCKAAAWPRMSAGLAGYVSAEQWIYESDEELLFPVPEEAPYYNALLEVILAFHTGELTAFLEGNRPCADPESFSTLHGLVKDRTGEIAAELAAATETAEGHFTDGEHPLYYLPQDLR